MNTTENNATEAKKKVAAYVRISGRGDALNPLAVQVDYYTNLIQNNEAWQFTDVYADGVTTNKDDKCKAFRRLLSDCCEGKIDMVITKSISRFARNTVTLLRIVKALKILNIDVYFEKENLHSMSGDGEFMLTLISAIAEAESSSAVSDNTAHIKQVRGGKK